MLGGQGVRVQRMLDGLQAEGEAPVLVHWALSEDIRTLHRVRTALDAGRPLPMALRENRVWGVKEKLMERALPLLTMATLAQVAGRCAHGGRHRQRPQVARLAGRSLGGFAADGHARGAGLRSALR